MIGSLKKNIDFIGLTIILFSFFIYKIPFFELPFFWDEAWVYGPSVEYLTKFRLSFLPSDLPIDLSRGHPLMFHFFGGLWCKVFGFSPFSLHLYSQILFTFLTSLVFIQLKKISSPFIAISFLIIFLSLPITIAQSSLFLPEMALGLLICLGLLFYVQDKIWAFVMCLSLSVLIKETGFVGAFIFVCYEIINSLLNSKFKTLRVLKILIPCAVFGLFLIVQKFTHGWFFYPDHIGLIEIDLKTVKDQSLLIYNYLFESPNFYPLTLITLFSILLFNQAKWKNVIIIFCLMIAVKIYFDIWKLPFPLDLTIPAVLALLGGVLFYRKTEFRNTDNFILLAFILAIGFIAFSSINFFTLRYSLFIIPTIIITFLLIINRNLNAHYSWFKYVISGIAIIMVSLTPNEVHIRDTDPNYKDGIEAEKQFISYLEEKKMYEEFICLDFMGAHNLSQTKNGYRKTNTPFSNLQFSENESTTYIVDSYTNSMIELDCDHWEVEKNFSQNNAQIILYKRKSYK